MVLKNIMLINTSLKISLVFDSSENTILADYKYYRLGSRKLSSCKHGSFNRIKFYIIVLIINIKKDSFKLTELFLSIYCSIVFYFDFYLNTRSIAHHLLSAISVTY